MSPKWLLIGALCLAPSLTWAQSTAFDNAIGAIRMQAPTVDTSGFTVRGGANFSTGTTQSQTLMRGSATIGGTCGSFDFGASFKEMFEEIPTVIQQLTAGLVHQLPMIALCYLEPVICDVAKQMQNFINATLQARYAQCQGAQNAAMWTGLRLRGGEISKCLEEQAKQGNTSISQALRVCNDSPSFLRRPDGSTGTEIRVIEDTLRVAGASPEVQTLAPALMGEITLRAGDGLGFQSGRPQQALMARYESHKATATTAIETVAEEMAETGTVSAQTLQAASLPGRPFARATAEALASMRGDPDRYAAHVGRLSTGNALARLQWECAELQNQLDAAAEGNAHLSDEVREQLRKRNDALRRELAQFMAKIDVEEKYYTPAVDALLRDHAAIQQQVTDLGIRAPAVSVNQPGRYRTQQPLGYSR